MFKGDYIAGEFVLPKQPEDTWNIASPANLNDIVGEFSSQESHVEKACAAAKYAFRDWALKSMDERKSYLIRLKEVFDSRQDEVAEMISRETGKPLWESKTEAGALSKKIDVTISHSAKSVADMTIPGALPNVEGQLHYKPRGVMLVIGPFNFPAHLPNGHIIPALLMGNTVVYKPSEKTPMTGQLIAEMIAEIGLPAGVFNFVQGRADLSRQLVSRKDVDGVLFTGSYEVGLKIKQSTVEDYWKLLALEMGGKNSTLIWEDADLEKAVYDLLIGSYLTTGQRCSCTSRIILHSKIRDKFLENFCAATVKLKVGHWSEDVFMGPLISKESKDNYLKIQEKALKEGCKALVEGKSLDLNHPGHYVSPSVMLVERLDLNSVYQSTEIFGPNVAIYVVDEYKDAVDIINAGGYGLVASVFTQNEDIKRQLVVDARVGLLNCNRPTNGASAKLPFGGMGKSGNDRASGDFAVQYCTVPVAMLHDKNQFDPGKVAVGVDYEFK